MSISATSGTSSVVGVVQELSQRFLEVYRVDSGQIAEHANAERSITQGGYGERQIYELVQNGADENLESSTSDVDRSRIHVLLTPTHLYCANTGTPMSASGAETILRMAVSKKRAGQIGRFGVGVKSVLTVSDTPRFYSRHGSFGFDKEESDRLIREAVPTHPVAAAVPVLRLAHTLDLQLDRATDPLLDQLMEWAATTVVLPLKEGADERLGQDLRDFPEQFMLFSPHVDELILEDARPGHLLARVIQQQVDGAERHVVERRNDKAFDRQRWLVFSVDHEPTPAAAATAGEQNDRPMVTVSWAVPDKGLKERTQRGKFWAYFPTHYDTTLTGIINAPWKTPEDRQNLTKSVFNDELVGVAARLVVDSIPALLDPEDPGSYLTLLTARGREASQWGDRDLSSEVLDAAARTRSLPDQEGELQFPEQLLLHPQELRAEWLERWADYPGRPRNWCHRTVENRERRSRARDILERAGVGPARLREWLEALVEDRSVDAARAALFLAADVVSKGTPAQAEEARSARILLAEDGHFHAPDQRSVFRRSGAVRLPNDTTVYLYDELAEDPGAHDALTVLGVQEANAAGRLRAAVATGFSRYGDSAWEGFWALARAVGAEEVAAILRERHPEPARVICVRTADGRFKPLRDCLMAGPVVPGDGSRDVDILVDPVFHAQDSDILRALGGVDGPSAGADHPIGTCDEPGRDGWQSAYRDAAYAELRAALPSYSSNPRRSSVAVNGPAVPGPLHLLMRLSPPGRAAFIKSLPDTGVVVRWTCRRTTANWEKVVVQSPLIWMLRKHGRLHTTLGIRTVTEALSPELSSAVDGALLALADLPVGVARALELPATLADVPTAMWSELARRADTGTDAGFVGAAYALLAAAAPAETLGERGRQFRCSRGDDWTNLPASGIAVTASRDEYERLLRERVPALLAPDDEAAQLLISQLDFGLPSDLLVEEIDWTPLTDPVPLTDFFPRLRQRFRKASAWKVAHCSELVRVVRTPGGRREEALTEVLDGVTVLLCGERDETEILRVADRLLGLQLGEAGRRQVLELQGQDADAKRRAQVEREPDLEAKLLLAVGAERLVAALPAGLRSTDAQLRGRPVDGPRAAALLRAAHGENVLQILAPALKEAGFDVPSQWTGTLRAQEFVRRYGFPISWAGDPETPASPAPYETVPGPSRPLPLHAYQEALVDKMYEHLANQSEGRDRRAMLEIPTGSGKTRIAAEAGVRALRDGILRGPVLWITQSRELAEQAIETWSYVWRAEGGEQPLRITRLWGGMPDAVPVDGPQVVVAIDDTAVIRLEQENYTWLCECALVFIDEAHFAVPKTYTRILDLLGIDQRRTSRPLIGLTATAYRGENVVETGTLAARFGHNRLDRGVFENDDAYAYLQKIGVLARVEQDELLGGRYSLTPEQIDTMRGAGEMTLPAAVLRDLEQDVERTNRIVERILALPSDWPVLVFATSVEHAQVLAALLSDRGRVAASIEGKTPPSIRRRRIADFRAGRIKVLTNYMVLTQGFDAPAVKAVVVARPTYSPNTYIQMIGRGLRGELNGGKDTCLILNVADNIENFGRSLAYKGMDWVWERGAAN